jgi:hypothetical protein
MLTPSIMEVRQRLKPLQSFRINYPAMVIRASQETFPRAAIGTAPPSAVLFTRLAVAAL